MNKNLYLIKVERNGQIALACGYSEETKKTPEWFCKVRFFDFTSVIDLDNIAENGFDNTFKFGEEIPRRRLNYTMLLKLSEKAKKTYEKIAGVDNV